MIKPTSYLMNVFEQLFLLHPRQPEPSNHRDVAPPPYLVNGLKLLHPGSHGAVTHRYEALPPYLLNVFEQLLLLQSGLSEQSEFILHFIHLLFCLDETHSCIVSSPLYLSRVTNLRVTKEIYRDFQNAKNLRKSKAGLKCDTRKEQFIKQRLSLINMHINIYVTARSLYVQ